VASVSDPAAKLHTALDLKTTIRNATRALENLLGPTSEGLCLQIEKCKSMPELTAKINDLRGVVAQVRSAQKADEFVAAALGH
jgi:hypothetical protein